MSFLSFLGGEDSNPYAINRGIGDRQYGQADQYRGMAKDYRGIAASYRNGQMGKQLYEKNQRGANTLLSMAINSTQRDLASKGINSSALNKQNAMEFAGQTQDKLYGANLDAWSTIQDKGLQYEGVGQGYEGLGTQYENLANQNMAQYGAGEQWKGEQKNSFLNQVMGLGGSLLGGSGLFGGSGQQPSNGSSGYGANQFLIGSLGKSSSGFGSGINRNFSQYEFSNLPKLRF